MTNNTCAICLDTIDDNDTTNLGYNLPECNCKFHVGCIIHWFRQGQTTCPNCRNSGCANIERPIYGTRWCPDIGLAKKFAKKNPDHEINKYLRRGVSL